MKRRRTRRVKAALPANPVEQVLGDLIGEVQRNLLKNILPPMFQPQPQPPSEIKDAEVISIRNNP